MVRSIIVILFYAMRALLRHVEKLGLTFVAVGLGNFVLFMAVALMIGGGAFNGKVEGGRHFLSLNGRYTEVSRGVWNYSVAHTASLVITVPMLFAGALIMGAVERRQRKTQQRDNPPLERTGRGG